MSTVIKVHANATRQVASELNAAPICVSSTITTEQNKGDLNNLALLRPNYFLEMENRIGENLLVRLSYGKLFKT